jgi:hypothetical protein
MLLPDLAYALLSHLTLSIILQLRIELLNQSVEALTWQSASPDKIYFLHLNEVFSICHLCRFLV